MAPDLLGEAGEVGVVGGEFLVVLAGLLIAAGRPRGARRGHGYPARERDRIPRLGRGGRVDLVPDRLDPEDHGEDREQRPFERVRPAERVSRLGPVQLPVAEPEHPQDAEDHERVPAQPLGGDEEPPPGGFPGTGHAPSLTGPAGAGPRVCRGPAGTLRDNQNMSLGDLFRSGAAGRLPASLDELHGPEQGVIVLPRHLAWPGLREFDLSDDRLRRSVYGIVLAQGRRNDMARFVNARLLRADWPLLRISLDPKVRKSCERRLRLRA